MKFLCPAVNFPPPFLRLGSRLLLASVGLALGACSTQYRVVAVPEKTMAEESARTGGSLRWHKQRDGRMALDLKSFRTRPSVRIGVLNYSDRLGVPQLDARINGQSQRCVLDTGCAVPVAMDFYTARTLGLKLFPVSKINLTAQGAASEQIKCAFALADRFELAGIVDFRNMPTVILPRQYVYTRKVVGIPVVLRRIPLSLLGVSLFRGLSYLSFNSATKTVTFSTEQRFAPSPGADWVPMIWDGDQVYVQISVGRQNFKVRLDSGSSGAVDLPGSASVAGVSVRTVEPAISLDRVSVIHETLVNSVRLGTCVVPSVKVAQSPSGNGLLGYGLLRRYRFTLDFQRNVLWLEALEPARASMLRPQKIAVAR